MADAIRRHGLDFEWECGDFDDAVFHLGAEEMGRSRFDGFGFRVLVEFKIEKHEAEVFFTY
jgi:hypothetical protein